MLTVAVANVAQTNSGMRVQVMPGARILTIVTVKFIPVSVDEMPTMKIAMHHSAPPGPCCSETGGYSVHPASGAPTKNELNNVIAATGTSQKLSMFSHGNATSRAPICSGITKLPIAPVTSGISDEPDHRRPVHREHRVVVVEAHERPLGVRELHAHQFGERSRR